MNSSKYDVTKHIGPVYLWRIYERFGKWNDREEIGVGFGNRIYFYFGIAVFNGFITFTFRVSGIGKLSETADKGELKCVK